MELIQLACSKCNYTAELLLGTQDPGQTFSDLNEDFAFYKLFQCDADGAVLSIDVNNREFDGSCPQHKVKLQPLAHFPHACPRCGSPINVTHKDIFKPERGQ